MKRVTTISSVAIAVGVAAAFVVWMASGYIGRDPAPASERTTNAPGAPSAPIAVSVRPSSARTITREIVVSANTEPNRVVELRAEMDGRVVELGAERGSRIGQSQLIVSLDMRDLEARIAEAEALIAQRELQYEAALDLEERQLVSDVQIAEARANLVAARAALEQNLVDLRHTRIRAPFDGVLDEREVELGDYVRSGDIVARVVDTDPLLIVGEVNERNVASISVGNAGTARLVSGQTVEGTIRYLAPVAAASTRTFRVELAVPNPAGEFRAGMTAEMYLAADEITAHFLTAALLTLDDAGNIGVKAVDDFDQVRFHPVEIVSSTTDGVGVTGLPDEVSLITIGQGFVTDGQLVAPVPDPTAQGGRGELSESKQPGNELPARL